MVQVLLKSPLETKRPPIAARYRRGMPPGMSGSRFPRAYNGGIAEKQATRGGPTASMTGPLAPEKRFFAKRLGCPAGSRPGLRGAGLRGAGLAQPGLERSDARLQGLVLLAREPRHILD